MATQPTDTGAAETSPAAKTPLYLTIAWVLLLLLGAFMVFAALSDLAADAGAGLPSDHLAAFASVAGASWQTARQTSAGIAHYVTLLEVGYAFHELVSGLLFLVIVAIPFRRRALWAWWACWIPMIANIAYTLTFGAHDPAILRTSLIADIALPVLLLVQAPAFFGRRAAAVRKAQAA
ncbi:MAG TPA: hypothetical protein VF116_02980 [Ktedonobacterales bacterium]